MEISLSNLAEDRRGRDKAGHLSGTLFSGTCPKVVPLYPHSVAKNGVGLVPLSVPLGRAGQGGDIYVPLSHSLSHGLEKKRSRE